MWQFCMGKQEISGSNVAMSMQQIKMLACEGAPGKLPVLVVCDADVVVGCAIVIAQWVTRIIVRYGSKISWCA